MLSVPGHRSCIQSTWCSRSSFWCWELTLQYTNEFFFSSTLHYPNRCLMLLVECNPFPSGVLIYSIFPSTAHHRDCVSGNIEFLLDCSNSDKLRVLSISHNISALYSSETIIK
eukprot:NODE_187_length_15673_cov_0.222743.p10 type:complete len:113 gc:universal NODE_187_length_15673_cov_0.222743:5628-5290(-)